MFSARVVYIDALGYPHDSRCHNIFVRCIATAAAAAERMSNESKFVFAQSTYDVLGHLTCQTADTFVYFILMLLLLLFFFHFYHFVRFGKSYIKYYRPNTLCQRSRQSWRGRVYVMYTENNNAHTRNNRASRVLIHSISAEIE